MATPGYQYTEHTGTEIRARLASRLNDPDNCFWSASELDVYIQEALDTWALYSQFYSCKSTLTVAAGEVEVDLNTLLTSTTTGSEAPLKFTISGQKILSSILLHLVETRNPDVTTYTPTTHISANLLNHYISIAFNQFIQDSACYVNKREYPITAPILSGEPIYSLDQSINNIVRAEHITLANDIRLLRRVSLENSKYIEPGVWNSKARPKYYSLETTAALKLYLLPWPNDISTLRLYTIEHSPLLVNLLSSDQSWNLPYEFWPAIKFLALHKIYSTDGPTRWPQMSTYCLSRYNQYVQLARGYSALSDGWTEEGLLTFTTIGSFDNTYTGWRNKSSLNTLTGGATPRRELAILSPNKVFIRQKLDRTLGLSFDVVRNAPNFTPSDPFPIGEDYLPYVLDYSEHLALLKSGGKEFSDSMPLYSNFLYGAGRVNDKLDASIISPDKGSQFAKFTVATADSDRQQASTSQQQQGQG